MRSNDVQRNGQKQTDLQKRSEKWNGKNREYFGNQKLDTQCHIGDRFPAEKLVGDVDEEEKQKKSRDSCNSDLVPFFDDLVRIDPKGPN